MNGPWKSKGGPPSRWLSEDSIAVEGKELIVRSDCRKGKTATNRD